MLRRMLTLATLALWILAVVALLGHLVWWGMGLGVVAVAMSITAVNRKDDMERFFGLCLMALVAMTVIRTVSALLP